MVEKSYPELLPHVSSTKSPHMIVGSAIKNFFAKKIGRPAREVVVVSIMPCLKKQGEADRIMHQTMEGVRWGPLQGWVLGCLSVGRG
jgi:iron only hydrogenase large subunit-like protein